MAKYQAWIEPEGLLKIEGWARAGLIDEQIAHNIGISRKTLADWKKAHPCIGNALKKGKEVVDFQVENALLKRALGYTYTEVTQEEQPVYEDGQIVGYEMRVTKKVTKEVAPDTTAQIFWLKNRQPVKWRDKQEIQQTSKVNLDLSKFSTAQIKEMLDRDVEGCAVQ